jgi:hypothetical protein
MARVVTSMSLCVRRIKTASMFRACEAVIRGVQLLFMLYAGCVFTLAPAAIRRVRDPVPVGYATEACSGVYHQPPVPLTPFSNRNLTTSELLVAAALYSVDRKTEFRLLILMLTSFSLSRYV